jgi:hypothetical protein
MLLLPGALVGDPILWSACRHHVYKLFVKEMVEVVTGKTTDPGVALFRLLKAQWYNIPIDYEDLETFDYDSVPEWMAEEARSVLRWAEEKLEKGRWPRADYKEFLVLVEVSLGGKVQSFRFHLPGADHHARWMSKAIYYLKIWLLCKVFVLSEEEKEQEKDFQLHCRVLSQALVSRSSVYKCCQERPPVPLQCPEVQGGGAQGEL